jgi:hypothetical protein
VKFGVSITRELETTIYVEADSRAEAVEIANELPLDDFLFDGWEDDVSVAFKPLEEGDVEKFDLKGYPCWVGGPDGEWESL